MMNFTGLISNIGIDFDQAAYLAVMGQNADKLIKDAARAWLKAALLKVPIYSGTAAGTLKPMGAFLHQAIPSGSTVTRRKPLGAQTTGKFDFTDNNFVYQFTVEVDLFYYLINEYYDVSQYIHLIHPGPWGSFEAGEAAADKVLDERYDDLFPDLNDFFDLG